MRWEYRRVYVPLELKVASGKWPELKEGLMGSESVGIKLIPEESEASRVAWSQADELGRQGWELFQTLPVLGGQELFVGYQTGLAGTTYTQGYNLIFRRQVE